MTLSRRTILTSALAAPALLGVAGTAQAGGHGALVRPKAQSFVLGDFHVTTLLDGTFAGDEPQKTFGMNVDSATFAQASQDAFISPDRFQGFFTPTLVQNGTDTILFDTGLGRGGLADALAQAGVAPEDITHVVLTHMHPDHIGGLSSESGVSFPNAVYVTGSTEYNFWTGAGSENRVGQMVASKVVPLAEKMTFVDPGASIAPGITAVDAFGHTPGHMGYMLESGGRQFFLAADLANHYVWSLAHPDWEVRFDADKTAAAASRRRVLGMLAADRVPMIGYHMPFPGVGFVEAKDSGFRWVAHSYQLLG